LRRPHVAKSVASRFGEGRTSFFRLDVFAPKPALFCPESGCSAVTPLLFPFRILLSDSGSLVTLSPSYHFPCTSPLLLPSLPFPPPTPPPLFPLPPLLLFFFLLFCLLPPLVPSSSPTSPHFPYFCSLPHTHHSFSRLALSSHPRFFMFLLPPLLLRFSKQ